MLKSNPFRSGMLAGILLAIAAQAGNWMITSHPDASQARKIAVVLQAVVALSLSVWLMLRARASKVAAV